MQDTIYITGQLLSAGGLLYGAWLTFAYRDLLQDRQHERRLHARLRSALTEIRHVAGAAQGLGLAAVLMAVIFGLWMVPRLLFSGLL